MRSLAPRHTAHCANSANVICRWLTTQNVRIPARRTPQRRRTSAEQRRFEARITPSQRRCSGRRLEIYDATLNSIRDCTTVRTSPANSAKALRFARITYSLVWYSKLIDAGDNNLIKPLSLTDHCRPLGRASLIEISPIGKASRLQPVTIDQHPPRRLTAPAAFPDLDAALAARGIALKAGDSRRKVKAQEQSVADAAEPPIDEDGRLSPHPAAFVGAVLGLALVGLLVFSVMKVSGDSIRPAAPIINMPASSTAAPTPVAEPPPPATPAATPPTPDVAPPQLAAASQAVPAPTPASPTVPSALSIASSVTAQTMVVQPPPQPEAAPEDSLRSRLHERFPQLFPEP